MKIALYSSGPQMGKTTIAKYIQVQYGFQPFKLATPIKGMLWSLLSDALPHSTNVWALLEGPTKEMPIKVLGGRSPRQLMQTLGTEWGRSMDENFWVNIVLNAIRNTELVVIDYVRFPNEYALLKEEGFSMWRVHRGTATHQSHASEGALDAHEFERTLWNRAGVPELTDYVDIALNPTP